MENGRNKIAIIGGTGKVGRYIVKQALAEGYSVRMLARNPDRVTISDERLEVVKGDAQDSKAVSAALQDCDVVINAFGQPNREKFPIYSELTRLIISLMKEAGIRRYIGITGASLNAPGDRKSTGNRIGAAIFRLLYPAMMEDKRKELNILQNSHVDWTLLRLPFVIEGPAINEVKVNELDMPGMKMRSADISAFIVKQIADSRFIRKYPFISN
ncbi:NAD(P)-dependent oxidoreductase [Paenibacillus beijingensis]|uniref:NADH-flavin reductase n=1 Tax=Paenibacillus beijingensis TaxID=1126833 RepID=A0A0D5NFI9_9BACL|nr:SDR family oxidoreductase [Paenibacillus beijingensis]AJY73668.1 NADH-flavin reductase [Paenibacillus beijingensis]